MVCVIATLLMVVFVQRCTVHATSETSSVARSGGLQRHLPNMAKCAGHFFVYARREQIVIGVYYVTSHIKIPLSGFSHHNRVPLCHTTCKSSVCGV